MRLAFLTNNRFPPREGIGRHILEVASRLRARGHEVTVLARGNAFAPWAETVAAGLRVRHFPHYPLRPFHHALAQHELARWLREGADGADLVHVHLPLLPPLLTDRPLVVTVHSPMLQDTAAITEPGLWPALIKANARLFSRRYEQWYLDHAASIVAVSQAVADELATGYRLRGRPIVIPNGVDTGFFGFAPSEGRTPTILYVGRLGYRKGLFRLLEAFARLPRRLGLELALVGEGPLEQALRRRAAALGIAPLVRFAGFLDRAGVRRELQAAACLVSPADYESGPLTLLEAMACGTPVVTTPTGLAAEMGQGAPAVLSAAEPEALAEAIAGTLAEPEAAAARARAARALVVARYGWEQVVDRLEAVYGVRRAERAA
ncbi:glycosyltransferase family 4 protein [Benzoatithermus flavus]|uniref:Glycosyltransferase family 4 protein n=1 Tax=Benzoatithermus flavus TaxID=3108223 RepID=A0ABU8XWS4_9PROT